MLRNSVYCQRLRNFHINLLCFALSYRKFSEKRKKSRDTPSHKIRSLKSMKKVKMNRRQFLATGVATMATPYLISSHVFGANEQVNVGMIGLGPRCSGLYMATIPQVNGINIAAVCDIFQPRVDALLSQSNNVSNPKGYDDFRKMIETENLDGVMVETTTHARAWIACIAMQMGMHAYIEKPMCLTISEGRAMVNTARHYKRVTQVGTQQRSIALNNWASDLVLNGAIGKVKVVEAPNFVGPDIWKPLPGEPMPEGGKEGWWDIWTNQAELRPYHPQIHYGWSRWWDYDAGGLCFGVSGWGTHSYDQVNRALGTSETGPIAIILEEPSVIEDSGKFPNRKIEDDETGSPYYGMAKVTGPRGRVKMLFANGTELRLHLDGDKGPGLGAIFIGENGKIEINRDKVSANPKELLERDDNPGHLTRDETAAHIENWVQCIRSGEKCNADIEYGQRGSTLCDLVNIVRKVGKVGETLRWDPEKERFTNCDEANAFLSRPRRQGYELPELT
ncbi:MAG: Gfo/Idh/MocA family oxidoreductase [Thermoguttaceae bacterium]|nr:Gfo/Idh/MocA family oxidoreductase [Thermoguttaceae bacterium]